MCQGGFDSPHGRWFLEGEGETSSASSALDEKSNRDPVTELFLRRKACGFPPTPTPISNSWSSISTL